MSKRKLVENVVINPDSYIKHDNLNESEQVVNITEAKGKKKEYKAKAVYTFPISKPDEKNLNERVYPTKLWEKVIKESKNKTFYGLMDHPKDEGSTKDRWCVWRNLRFSEDKKTVLADAYLFGKWGQEVLEGLEAGGPVGLSTSGYGEMQEDETTVDPDSYELERVADFVFNPSYEVYGTEDDRVDNQEESEKSDEEPIEEEVENENEEVPEEKETIKEEEEKITEDEEDTKIEEKETPEMKNTEKVEAKALEIGLKTIYKEAQKKETLSEKISAYEELLGYFDEGVAPELKTEVQEALDAELQKKEELAEKGGKVDELIDESTSELKEKVTDLEEQVSTLTKEKESLSTKYTESTELLDSIKVYTNKLKEMYDVALAEKNGMVTATEYKEALAYIEELEESKKEAERKVLEYRAKSKRPASAVTEKKGKKDEAVEEDEKEDNSLFEKYPRTPDEVIEYYLDLEYAVPEVVTIKEDIMKSKTLFEAQSTYTRLKGLLSENPEYTRIDRDREVMREEKKDTSRPLKRPSSWV